MNFNEINFRRKKYSKGILYFIDGFDFQKDIPNRSNKTQQDFLGKTSLLEFSERENVKIFITNEDLEKNFEKIDEETYLVSIKKFISFYESLKNNTNFDLAHAFFTNNLDVKNSYFSKDDYFEILKRKDFQDFLKTLKDEDLQKIRQIFPEIKNLDLSQISIPKILDELQRRNLDPKEFLDFAKGILNSKENFKNEELQNLTNAIAFKKIKNILKIWEDNKTNCSEDFWQKLFQDNAWVLQQIFSFPVIILQGETYVGGKNTKGRSGQGGVATDFLGQDQSTNSFAVVEIKTPCTEILGENYRGNKDTGNTNEIYSMHAELSGGIVQLQNQISTAIKSFKDNLGDDFSEENLNHLNPHGVLIIGQLEKLGKLQKKSFFLFRKGIREITIITFDEIFQKIDLLKKIFNE